MRKIICVLLVLTTLFSLSAEVTVPNIPTISIDEAMNLEEGFVIISETWCPYCVCFYPIISEIIQTKDIKNIYLSSVDSIKTVYSLNSNNELIQTREGTPKYFEALKWAEPILEDYILEDKNGVEHFVGEKRFYMPCIIKVKEKRAIQRWSVANMPDATLSDTKQWSAKQNEECKATLLAFLVDEVRNDLLVKFFLSIIEQL